MLIMKGLSLDTGLINSCCRLCTADAVNGELYKFCYTWPSFVTAQEKIAMQAGACVTMIVITSLHIQSNISHSKNSRDPCGAARRGLS